jgi:hypothetical protein
MMSQPVSTEPDAAELREEVAGLRREVGRLNTHRFVRLHNSLPKLLLFNLMRGAAFGLGTVLGASVVLSFLVWSISQIEMLPVIGEWAAEIARQMEAAAER